MIQPGSTIGEIDVNLPEGLEDYRTIIIFGRTSKEIAEELNSGITRQTEEIDQNCERSIQMAISLDCHTRYSAATRMSISTAKEKVIDLVRLVKTLVEFKLEPDKEISDNDKSVYNTPIGTIEVTQPDEFCVIEFYFYPLSTNPVIGCLKRIDPKDVNAQMIGLLAYHLNL